MPRSPLIIETKNPQCPAVLKRINRAMAMGNYDILVVNLNGPRAFHGSTVMSRLRQWDLTDLVLKRNQRQNGMLLSPKARRYLIIERLELEIQLLEKLPLFPLRGFGCKTIGKNTYPTL